MLAWSGTLRLVLLKAFVEEYGKCLALENLTWDLLHLILNY